jgi:hypothetical protein
MAFEVCVMHIAVRKNFRDGVANGFSNPQLSLRATRRGVLFVVAGHQSVSH